MLWPPVFRPGGSPRTRSTAVTRTRDALQDNGIGDVLAVACDDRVPLQHEDRADVLAAGVPTRSWQRLSAGPAPKASLLRLGVGRHHRPLVNAIGY